MLLLVPSPLKLLTVPSRPVVNHWGSFNSLVVPCPQQPGSFCWLEQAVDNYVQATFVFLCGSPASLAGFGVTVNVSSAPAPVALAATASSCSGRSRRFIVVAASLGVFVCAAPVVCTCLEQTVGMYVCQRLCLCLCQRVVSSTHRSSRVCVSRVIAWVQPRRLPPACSARWTVFVFFVIVQTLITCDAVGGPMPMTSREQWFFRPFSSCICSHPSCHALGC